MTDVNYQVRNYRYTYDLTGSVSTRVRGIFYADSDERARTFLQAQIIGETNRSGKQDLFCPAFDLVRDDDVRVAGGGLDSGYIFDRI